MSDQSNTAATPARPARKKMRRAEKSEANRQALIKAATQVIGKHGYAGASIARIAEKAGLAQGTFYLYFDSQQDLFDKLLLQLGEDMQKYLAEQVVGARDYFEVEERGLRAFFAYIKKNPSFFRVLKEAEVHAPEAFHAHEAAAHHRYYQSLVRAQRAGQIGAIQPRELDLITHMLMGMRYSIQYGCSDQVDKNGLPDWIVETHMRFVRGALGGPPREEITDADSGVAPKPRPAARKGRNSDGGTT